MAKEIVMLRCDLCGVEDTNVYYSVEFELTLCEEDYFIEVGNAASDTVNLSIVPTD